MYAQKPHGRIPTLPFEPGPLLRRSMPLNCTTSGAPSTTCTSRLAARQALDLAFERSIPLVMNSVLTSVTTRCSLLRVMGQEPKVFDLRAVRTERQLSQEALARLLGVSVRTVVRWEHGHSAPSALAQTRLQQVLGTEKHQ